MTKEKRGGRNLIGAAVEEGLGRIVERHPRLRGANEYVAEHIDQRRLKSRIIKLQNYLARKAEWSDDKKVQFMYKDIANYVASGRAFDESAKELILRRGLDEDNLDKAGEAFRDIYKIMKSSDYAERLPELAEAVGTVYDLGFLDTTIRVLRSRGALSEGQYETLEEAIRRRKSEAVERAGYSVKNYLASAKERHNAYKTMRRVAAVIIGISGAALALFSGANLTGNVVGYSIKNFTGNVFGLLLWIFALILFLKK